MTIKSFFHDWVDGTLYVWRDDNDSQAQIALTAVVTHHQRPNSHADNPDDFRGYVDWHFEEWERTIDWDDSDTREALKYAAQQVDEKKLIEDLKEARLDV